MTGDLVIRSGTVMTPYGGLEGGVTDPLAHVESRGRVIMRDGELVGEPGWGKPVVPATTTVVA